MKREEPRYVRAQEHEYCLQSHPSYYFEVGGAEGTRALWGLLGDAAYLLVFDGSGNLQRVERRSVEMRKGQLSEALTELSAEIRSDMALDDSPIVVRRFWVDEIGVGVEDLGEDLKAFRDDEESFDAEEREEMNEALGEWLSGGMFVFWWEQAFEMNAEGEVETS